MQEDACVRRCVLRMDFDACAPLHQSDIGLFQRDIAFIQGHDDCIKKPLIGSLFGSYSELRARSTVARLDVKVGGH